MVKRVLPVAFFLVSVMSKVIGLHLRKLWRTGVVADVTRSIRLQQKKPLHHSAEQQPFADPLVLYHALRNCKDAYISSHINIALDVLSDALRLYGSENVLSSYNGGKDADVIMHLLRAVAASMEHQSGERCAPKMIYFAIEDEFQEVLDHIAFSTDAFGLDITRYNCGIVQVFFQNDV